MTFDQWFPLMITARGVTDDTGPTPGASLHAPHRDVTREIGTARFAHPGEEAALGGRLTRLLKELLSR